MKSELLFFAVATFGTVAARAADDVSLVTGGERSVYGVGETPALTLAVTNRADAPRRFAVNLRTVDYFGSTVGTRKETFEVVAKGFAEKKLDYPELTKPGFYCTVADWTSDGPSGTAEGSFVKVGPEPAKADILFGVTCFAPDNLPDLFRKMGVGTKGVIFPWSWMEDKKNPGRYDFSEKMRAVKALRRAGVRVYGMVDTEKYTPAWLSRKAGPKEDPVADPVKYYAEAENFFRALVETFRDDIDEWAVSCEINIAAPGKPYLYQRHLDLVRLFSRTAKAVNPKVKVLSMSVSGADGREVPRFRFTREMMPKIADCLDGFAPDQYTEMPCYGEGYSPVNSEEAALREIMEEAIALADAHKLELVTIDEKGPSIVCSTPVSSQIGRRAADMVARDFIILKTLPRVRHWLYYCLFNGNPKALVGYGAWQHGNPRQAVAAYAATARTVGGAKFEKGLAVHGDIPCWTFEKDGRHFAALWYNGRSPLRFRLAEKPAEVRDVMGNPVPAGADLTLTSSPTYVFYPSSDALAKALEGASFDVPLLSALVETMAVDETLLVLRNLTDRPLDVRVTDFRTEPATARPAVLADAIPLAPREVRKVALPYSARRTAVTLAAGRGGAVTAEGCFAPTRVKRVAAWEDLADADEVVLDNPHLQTPGYADLQVHGAYRDLDDLSVRARFGYDDEALWMEYRVTDDVNWNESPLGGIYNGDSVQFAIDTENDARIRMLSGARGFDDNDYSLAIAHVRGASVTRCYASAAVNRRRLLDKPLAAVPEVVRDEAAKITRYRVRIPFADLCPLKPVKGRAFGFSFLVWDFDPPETGGYYIQSTPGLANPHDPSRYAQFVFD